MPTPALPPAARTCTSVNRFATALSRAPALKVVQAELPAVWNTALLEISTNTNLEAIRLSPSPPVAGAHIFLAEARKHPRLAQLIENGTPIAPQPVLTGRMVRSGTLAQADVGMHRKMPSLAGRLRANTTVGATSSSIATSSRCIVAFPVSSSPSPSGSSSSGSGSLKVPNVQVQEAEVQPTIDIQAKIERRASRKAGRRQSKTNRRMSAV